MPHSSEMHIDKTEASTDVAPLIPQSQGDKDGERFKAMRMPSGKAMPMKKPIGTSVKTDSRMRTTLDCVTDAVTTGGVTKPESTRMTKSATSRINPFDCNCSSLIACVVKLPSPLASNSEKRTTDRP